MPPSDVSRRVASSPDMGNSASAWARRVLQGSDRGERVTSLPLSFNLGIPDA